MNRINNLGLCQRAGFLISGEDFVLDGIKSKTLYLVFLANDASLNTKKRITDKAKFYDIPVCEDFNSDELSKAIGKTNRKVLGITDANFAKILKK